MVAADQRLPVRQTKHRAVRERGFRSCTEAAQCEKSHVGVERNFSQGNDDRNVWKRCNLGGQMRQTVGEFLERRLVLRRRAACRRGNVDVAQHQSVVGMPGGRDAGEAVFVQRRHQEVARSADPVTRERSTGAVGAVRCRRQRNEQHARVRIPETRYRPAPIRLIAIGAFLQPRDVAAIRAQPRALVAQNDCRANALQFVHNASVTTRDRRSGAASARSPCTGTPWQTPACSRADR